MEKEKINGCTDCIEEEALNMSDVDIKIEASEPFENSEADQVKTSESVQNADSDDKKDVRIKELENQMARLSADFANFKKRSEREKSDIYQFANEDLIKAFLPALDDYDRAIDYYDEEKSDAFGQGVNLIFKKLIEVLQAKGVREIEALGADFDPNFHHAVEMSKNDEYESGKVCDVLLKGYMLNDKVIRPSMVRVSE